MTDAVEFADVPEETPSPRRAAAEHVLQEFRGHARTCVEVVQRLADALVKVREVSAQQYAGCSSLVDLCVKNGIPEGMARDAAHIADAYALEPQVRAEVEARNIDLGAAAVLGRVYKNPAVADKCDWLVMAQGVEPRDLLEEYWDKLGEVTSGRPVQQVTIRVTASAYDELKRAQIVMSRSVRRIVTFGEVVTRGVAEFLERHDPLRNGEGTGTRRTPDTKAMPWKRYVPLAVRLALRLRSNDRCCVPGCSAHVFVDACHVIAHVLGSGREEDDLEPMCHRHNLMHAAGDLVIRGPPGAHEFYNRAGERL